MNGKREKFTSTWKPKTQPSTHHAKRFYRKKFAPPVVTLVVIPEPQILHGFFSEPKCN
jgi:hypothetical protein